MGKWRTLLTLALLYSGTLAVCQDAAEPPCIAKDEVVYRPGVDDVKPPKLLKTSGRNTSDVRGSTQLELLVNSKGAICGIRILKTTNHESALKLAEHVAKTLEFAPATRNGQPVAVRFLMNFNVAP